MTDAKQLTIEVDGRVLKAAPGAMLIEITDAAGIPIPRFCYHKKLSIAANCRMCLVEVDKVPKPLPACATPVSEGMKVYTRSPKALAAQKGTMEFLLINHPLDCPICDQGGECELQDVAMGYGSDVSRFAERKRVVADEDLGPLIATDMTRCIHCTRCVRFGGEVAGLREMGATGRGEYMRIGVYVSKTVDHELSGNIIDLCPVGALTSKPFRYHARAWELTQVDGVASHDSLGSNLHLHVRRGSLLRVHPRDNEAVNETWISDRDRFSYQGLYAADRLSTPLIKKGDQWREAEWDEALQLVATKLADTAKRDAGQMATLVSPRATMEEMYLAQKITRGLGSPHVDCRLRQGAFSDQADPLFSWLGLPVAQLEQADAALVIGANLRKEQPLLAHRLRKAAFQGADLVFCNPVELELTHPGRQIVAAPAQLVQQLAAIAKGLGVRVAGSKGLVHKTKSGNEHKAIGQRLKDAQRALVMLGGLAAASPEFTVLKGLALAIAEAAGATLAVVPAAANSVGAALAGALPFVAPGAKAAEPAGANAQALLKDPRRAYLLVGLEPDLDTWNPSLACTSLDKADFVVALSPWNSPSLKAVADVILPVGDFAETAGSYVNAEGRWQVFQGAVAPPGEARPAWKVLRVLGNLLDLEGFEFASAGEVRAELRSLCEGTVPDNAPRGDWLDEQGELPNGALYRIGDVPLYACDGLVRRAPALQATRDAVPFGAWIGPQEAQRLGLADGDRVMVSQGDRGAEASLTVDRGIPRGCVRIPVAVAGSEALGAACGPVTLEKV
jgi:NADH-quinone oxidoreductase subunit G